MSARLAWHRPWFRALTLLVVGFVLFGSIGFLVKLEPVLRESSTVVFHTNIYFGIDDVRPWYWVLLWPGAWLLTVITGILAAFGVYQRDALLAYSLMAWLLAWSCPWAIGLYYLMIFSTR